MWGYVAFYNYILEYAIWRFPIIGGASGSETSNIHWPNNTSQSWQIKCNIILNSEFILYMRLKRSHFFYWI